MPRGKKKDVTEEASSTSTEDVKTETVDVEPSATPPTEGTVEEPSTNEEPIAQGDVDDSGVPYKNRYFEWKRKAEDLSDKLPSLVEDTIQKTMSQYQQPKQEYTVAQLEAFAQQNPEHRGWVEEEKEKIRTKNLTKILDEKLSADRQRIEADAKRQQALKYTMDNYPEMFVKDNTGRTVDWNQQSPLLREVNNIMQDPRIKDAPDGLMIATDLAWARLERVNRVKSSQKQQKLQSEVKQLQKRTLVESGSSQADAATTPKQEAIERLKQTGSMTDAEQAIREMVRAKFGVEPE